MEITQGVHAFPQTVTHGGVEKTFNPAAVETPKGILLIDVGNPGTGELIADNLADVGRDFSDVRGVVMTHQDGDHAGALSEVVDRSGATVYAHERAAPYIDGRKHPLKSPEDDRYDPVGVDVEIVDGVSFRTDAGPMDAVYTPGHAPGHVSLHFPEQRLLIVGDALTADEDGLAKPKPQFTPDMDRALESARRLAELDVERILCYHGGLVEADSETIREVGRA